MFKRKNLAKVSYREDLHMLQSYVLANGTLDKSKLTKVEQLYQGINGRFVERFYLNDETSYIFKPLINNNQIGKELWLYQNILVNFPPIYPKILGFSNTGGLQNNWLIMEDLGDLKHVYNEKAAIQVSDYVAWWHQFPTIELQKCDLKGPKPSIEIMIKEILQEKEKISEILFEVGLKHLTVQKLLSSLSTIFFEEEKVLSHGDLHLGNYGYSKDKVVIIDWEHVHLNYPYWDLYHLIDSTHPDFPKKVCAKIRKKVLENYLNKRNIIDIKKRENFLYKYNWFSIIFTLWMVLLILKDLEGNQGKWSQEKLDRQYLESILIIKQCIENLNLNR
jgi:thiamine kinase-like enzyme